MVPSGKPVVSVVLGSYNRYPFLRAALESVRTNGQDFPYEIIVVDGGSTDGSLRYLNKQKDVITIIQHNRGEFRGKKIKRRSWGYFMNLGFKTAQGKYILMISDDCLLVPGALKNGVILFDELLSSGQKIGAMAFYWRNWPDQKEYYVGLTLGMKMMVNHGLFLRSALEEVGWIDEEAYLFYFADGDLCLKIWQGGYSVVDCKTAFVEHFGGLRNGIINIESDWETYLKRWEGIFYNRLQNNSGDRVIQLYDDPYMTFKAFPACSVEKNKLDKVRKQILKIASGIKGKVKQNNPFSKDKHTAHK
jgi:glycosyltransferase involved in cell wall biosynthesis